MRIGIDLGGSHTALALCNDDGTIIRKISEKTQLGNKEALCKAMKALALQICSEENISHAEIIQIGIGVPGSFESETCTLLFGTNLGVSDVCFANVFKPEFCCPVKLNNDANCAALGETLHGAAKGVNHMLMITLGTGVGGGIVIDKKIYTGFNEIAGELGHMVIQKDGELCGCGRKGCLEAYTSAYHFVRLTKRELDKGEKSCLTAQKDSLNAKMICDAVDSKDSLAVRMFDEYCDNLSCGLANFMNIFQPECITIGGGLAGYGEKLLIPLRKRLEKEEVFRIKQKNTLLKTAVLGNDAGLIGAAMLE